MDDQVRLGYQLAWVSIVMHMGERIWLAGFHHPGDTVSSSCLKELVQAAEAHTGVPPQPGSELVTQRITTQQANIVRIHRLADQHQAQVQRLQRTHTPLIGKEYHAGQLLKEPISPKKKGLVCRFRWLSGGSDCHVEAGLVMTADRAIAYALSEVAT